MIRSEHKPISKKDIYELKFNNHEKQLNTYSPFHKTFNKKIFLKKEKFKNKNNNNNIHLISLLRNKVFSKGDKLLFDIKKNYNSYSPYVTKMVANAAKLVKYNHTKYMPKEILLSSKNSNESLNNSINDINTDVKKKSYFGLDAKTPLYIDENDNDSVNLNTKNLIKSPSSIIAYNKGDSSKINKEENDIKEDDALANKIFNETYMNKKENYNNEEINNFFEKYSIEKSLTKEEKANIRKIINSSKFGDYCFISSLDIKDFPNNEMFTKTYSLVEDYKNPYDSLEKIKFNSKMKKTFEKIRDNLQFQKYQKQFNSICDLKISNSRMPNIKALNKQNLVNKMELLKNKNVINYFKRHKNNILNKKKLKEINIIRNNENDNNNNDNDKEYEKLSYEERIKKVKIEVWYLESNFHPESRLMSSVCYDFDEKKLYNYGGLGGKIYGDLWECKFNENKIVWERIYNYERNKEYICPLPRFGHTSHFYKKKIFIVGGEYKDWKRNLLYEEILWIYDIEKKEWNSLHKYEIKNRIILDRRSSKNLKLKKNFSDILLKIPLLISPNILFSKRPKKKNINKPIFTYSKKTEKKNFKKTLPCTRRNHTSLLIGSHIFIYGGISQNQEILNDCWIYDLKLNQWATIESIGKQPFSLAHHCCCLAIEKDQLINDTFNIYHKPKNIRGTVDLLKMDGVFFFGGINNNKIPNNILFHMTIGIKPVIFDIPKIEGRPPKPRIDASMDYAQNISMIIIYGGKNELEFSSYYDDMTLLDLRIMNWIQPFFAKEKPNKRAQHMSIIIGDELIIFGGTTGYELLNYDFTVVDLNLFNK